MRPSLLFAACLLAAPLAQAGEVIRLDAATVAAKPLAVPAGGLKAGASLKPAAPVLVPSNRRVSLNAVTAADGQPLLQCDDVEHTDAAAPAGQTGAQQ